MQYHLHVHPLYENLGSSHTISVLIHGFDVYGQKFLDACLQAGQIPGYTLSVTVVCSDADRDSYLNSRPAFSHFFNADDDSYGTVEFAQDINLNPCYIFARNLETARTLRTHYKNCSINFVQTGEAAQDFDGMHPIYAEEDFCDPEVERMALNAHMIWEKSWGTSHEAVLENFRKPYNYIASVSNVLSIKYKLFSVGIDLDTAGNIEAARLFSERMNENLNLLLWCEHKRWVVEKICAGMTKKNIYTCTSKATTKDASSHVCIVRSSPNQNLRHQWLDRVEMWDNANTAQLNMLDELDRMSVELHRHFAELAGASDRDRIISLASSVKTVLRDFPSVAVSFEELYSCMKDIMSAAHAEKAQTVRDKVCMYEENLMRNFEARLASMDECKAKTKASSYAQDIKQAFSGILESMRYTDYKHEDTALISSIPFILTYRTDINLVVPMFCDIHDSTKFFGNIASAFVINPQRIIYVCKAADFSEDAFAKLAGFAQKRKLRAKIELLIIGHPDERFTLPVHYAENVRGARDYVASIHDGVTVIDRNGSDIFSRSAGTFDFDSAAMTFSNAHNFSATFRYINKKPFISVSDVFYFNLSGTAGCDSPEFFDDYQELWALYRQNHYAWKRMTQSLKNYAGRNDIIATFSVQGRNANIVSRSYVLPFECREAAGKIVQALRDAGIIAAGSVEGFNTYSCRVAIQDKGNHEELFDAVFSEQEKLKSASAFSIYVQEQGRVRFRYNSMKVTDCLVLDENEKNPELLSSIRVILSRLKNMGYVFGHSVSDDGNISLTFATPQIKDLLTKAGRMLEVFVYHEAKKSPKFSDVASSYSFVWGEEHENNEFDCVITRGFCTFIIECKACYELDAAMYRKFARVSRNFGVNAKRILVADLGGHEESANNIQCRNDGLNTKLDDGTSVQIDTVYSELQDIVQVLMRSISG